MSHESSTTVPVRMVQMVRMVRCPHCGGEAVWSPDNVYRPFCSKHCKTIDLGAWASGDYRLPVKPADDLDGFPPSND